MMTNDDVRLKSEVIKHLSHVEHRTSALHTVLDVTFKAALSAGRSFVDDLSDAFDLNVTAWLGDKQNLVTTHGCQMTDEMQILARKVLMNKYKLHDLCSRSVPALTGCSRNHPTSA